MSNNLGAEYVAVKPDGERFPTVYICYAKVYNILDQFEYIDVYVPKSCLIARSFEGSFYSEERCKWPALGILGMKKYVKYLRKIGLDNISYIGKDKLVHCTNPPTLSRGCILDGDDAFVYRVQTKDVPRVKSKIALNALRYLWYGNFPYFVHNFMRLINDSDTPLELFNKLNLCQYSIKSCLPDHMYVPLYTLVRPVDQKFMDNLLSSNDNKSVGITLPSTEHYIDSGSMSNLYELFYREEPYGVIKKEYDNLCRRYA